MAMPGAFSCAATHLVGIQPVVADHLHPFVRNMLGKNRQEVHGIKNLEVTVNLGIDLGTVNLRGASRNRFLAMRAVNSKFGYN